MECCYLGLLLDSVVEIKKRRKVIVLLDSEFESFIYLDKLIKVIKKKVVKVLVMDIFESDLDFSM